MATMDLPKLKRSITPRVRERLEELLPGATVTNSGDRLRIRYGELDGTIGLDALARACHAEDRTNWGPIAGSFCNLVVARVQASLLERLRGSGPLGTVLPVIVPESREDALIAEATPVPDLAAASAPWLPGIRTEFFVDVGAGPRRVLVRDLVSLGVSAADLAARSIGNLKVRLPEVTVVTLAEDAVGRRILLFRSEGIAPALLLSPDAHKRMYAVLGRLADGPVRKILAVAPRSDTLLFCDLKDKSAASRMVGAAWADHEADTPDGIPLTPRLFTVGDAGEVRYLDVGIGEDRVADWTRHTLGPVTVRVPADWSVAGRDGKWIVGAGSVGPRLRVRLVTEGPTSPNATHALAERLKLRAGTTADTGHGFFNGLPWSWVDMGFHEGHATASMLVSLPGVMVILQSEIPEGAEPSQGVTMQKVIATISAVDSTR